MRKQQKNKKKRVLVKNKQKKKISTKSRCLLILKDILVNLIEVGKRTLFRSLDLVVKGGQLISIYLHNWSLCWHR